MRIKMLAVVPLAALLGACGVGGQEFRPAPQATATAPTKSPEDDEVPVLGSDAPKPEPEAPTARQGSRGNPWPIGTKVTTGEWDVTLGTPTNGTAAIMSENQFNSPPPEGQEFWLVPITVTYVGTESADPFWDLNIGFVGDDARTYDGSECGVTPNDWLYLGELYPGGTATGNACLSVPAGAPGLFTLSPTFGERVFFDHETA